MRIIDNILGFGGHGYLDPSYVCIHETAGPGAPATNIVSWWEGGGGYPVHYVGDWTGDCYYCVPEDEICWQVGNGNAYVIGIELCHAEDDDDFKRVWDLGVEWAAWQLSKRGWGTDRLISHDIARQWWGGTDHTDPVGYFEEFGRSWDEFVSDVDDYLSGSYGKDDDLQYIYNYGGDCHRFYNPSNGQHMFTLDDDEKANLIKAGWVHEGVAFKTRRGGSDPVYRMYNPYSGEHLFTVKYGEAKDLQSNGWKYEGVPFFAWGPGEGGTKVTRLFNPYAKEGDHILTASDKEVADLMSAGWRNEGSFAV